MRSSTTTALAVPLFSCIFASLSGQTLETETARLMPAHVFEAAGNLEYQFSADGRETAVPLAFAYGLASTWELVVEPVPFTAIRPAAALGTSGVGDIEVTLVHRWLDETGARPAFAFAGEIKVPTAESRWGTRSSASRRAWWFATWSISPLRRCGTREIAPSSSPKSSATRPHRRAAMGTPPRPK